MSEKKVTLRLATGESEGGSTATGPAGQLERPNSVREVHRMLGIDARSLGHTALTAIEEARRLHDQYRDIAELANPGLSVAQRSLDQILGRAAVSAIERHGLEVSRAAGEAQAQLASTIERAGLRNLSQFHAFGDDIRSVIGSVDELGLSALRGDFAHESTAQLLARFGIADAAERIHQEATRSSDVAHAALASSIGQIGIADVASYQAGNGDVASMIREVETRSIDHLLDHAGPAAAMRHADVYGDTAAAYLRGDKWLDAAVHGNLAQTIAGANSLLESDAFRRLVDQALELPWSQLLDTAPDDLRNVFDDGDLAAAEEVLEHAQLQVQDTPAALTSQQATWKVVVWYVVQMILVLGALCEILTWQGVRVDQLPLMPASVEVEGSAHAEIWVVLKCETALRSASDEAARGLAELPAGSYARVLTERGEHLLVEAQVGEARARGWIDKGNARDAIEVLLEALPKLSAAVPTHPAEPGDRPEK